MTQLAVPDPNEKLLNDMRVAGGLGPLERRYIGPSTDENIYCYKQWIKVKAAKAVIRTYPESNPAAVKAREQMRALLNDPNSKQLYKKWKRELKAARQSGDDIETYRTEHHMFDDTYRFLVSVGRNLEPAEWPAVISNYGDMINNGHFNSDGDMINNGQMYQWSVPSKFTSGYLTSGPKQYYLNNNYGDDIVVNMMLGAVILIGIALLCLIWILITAVIGYVLGKMRNKNKRLMVRNQQSMISQHEVV